MSESVTPAKSGVSPSRDSAVRLRVVPGFGICELYPGLLQQPRKHFALLWIGTLGELRFEAPDIFARNEFLHEKVLSRERVDLALVSWISTLPARVPEYCVEIDRAAETIDRAMECKAIDILDRYRLMTIATLRADGWPQATMVNYANEGLLLYFIISKQSQKFANIQRDSRVSIVVGRDFDDPTQIMALSIAANSSDVRDPVQREHAVDLVLERHPTLAAMGRPDLKHSAVMRAYCSIVTILDYSQGFGHADLLTVSGGISEMTPRRDDDWGFLQA